MHATFSEGLVMKHDHSRDCQWPLCPSQYTSPISSTYPHPIALPRLVSLRVLARISLRPSSPLSTLPLIICMQHIRGVQQQLHSI